MDGGNLAGRSVEIAVSVKLRARGGWLAAPGAVRCARGCSLRVGQQLLGVNAVCGTLYRGYRLGRRRFVSIRTSSSVFASSRWCRARLAAMA